MSAAKCDEYSQPDILPNLFSPQYLTFVLDTGRIRTLTENHHHQGDILDTRYPASRNLDQSGFPIIQMENIQNFMEILSGGTLYDLAAEFLNINLHVNFVLFCCVSSHY